MDEAIIRRAIRRVAEQRIREAMEAGQFDDLPGAGKPLPEADAAYDEQWWVRSWLRREGLERTAALDGPGERRARAVASAEVLRDAAADAAKGEASPRGPAPPVASSGDDGRLGERPSRRHG